MDLKFFNSNSVRLGNETFWTPLMLSILEENYKKMSSADLADRMGLTLSVVRNKLYELGLKKMEMEYFTDEQIQFLKDNYSTKGDLELSEYFESRWPKNKRWTTKHIRKKRVYLGLKRSEKELAFIRSKRSDVSPIGTIHIWDNRKDGKKISAIKTENGFVHYAPWLWQKHYGPIPEGYVVSYIDFDSTNVTIENLKLYTWEDNSRRHRFEKYPEDVKEVALALKKLNNLINKKENVQQK